MAHELLFSGERSITNRTLLHPDGSGRIIEAYDVPSVPPIEVIRQPTVVFARTPGKSPGLSIKMLGESYVHHRRDLLRVETMDTASNTAATAIFTPRGLKSLEPEPVIRFQQRRALESATLDDPDSFEILTFGQTLAWLLSYYKIKQESIAELAHVSNSFVSRAESGVVTEFIPNKKWESLIPAFQAVVSRHNLPQGDIAGEILRDAFDRNKATYRSQRRRALY